MNNRYLLKTARPCDIKTHHSSRSTPNASLCHNHIPALSSPPLTPNLPDSQARQKQADKQHFPSDAIQPNLRTERQIPTVHILFKMFWKTRVWNRVSRKYIPLSTSSTVLVLSSGERAGSGSVDWQFNLPIGVFECCIHYFYSVAPVRRGGGRDRAAVWFAEAGFLYPRCDELRGVPSISAEPVPGTLYLRPDDRYLLSRKHRLDSACPGCVTMVCEVRPTHTHSRISQSIIVAVSAFLMQLRHWMSSPKQLFRLQNVAIWTI